MGGKYALLVGINYVENPEAALKGCVNDTYIIKEIIMSKGFREENIVMMNDEESQLDNPTGANVKKALNWLCSNRQSDDILFFHYSGHGTLVPDDDPNRQGATEEAIVLSDMFLMVDDDIQQFFCKVPIGCQATFISDCCHSGGLLDHKSVVIGGDKRNDRSGAREGRWSRNDKDDVPREIPIQTLAQIMSQKLGCDVPATGSGINGSMAKLFGGGAGKLAMSFAVAALAGSAAGGAQGGDTGGGYSSLIQGAMSALNGGQDNSAGGGGLGGNLTSMLGSALGGSGAQGNPMAGLIASVLGGGVGAGPGGRLQSILAAAGAVGGQENLIGMVEQAFQGTQSVTSNGASPYMPPDSPLSDDVGILITGCQSNETSADVRPADGQAYGALTHTIETVFKQNPQTDYKDLVYGVRAVMLQDNVVQNPTLECSLKNASLPFICY